MKFMKLDNFSLLVNLVAFLFGQVVSWNSCFSLLTKRHLISLPGPGKPCLLLVGECQAHHPQLCHHPNLLQLLHGHPALASVLLGQHHPSLGELSHQLGGQGAAALLHLGEHVDHLLADLQLSLLGRPAQVGPLQGAATTAIEQTKLMLQLNHQPVVWMENWGKSMEDSLVVIDFTLTR